MDWDPYANKSIYVEAANGRVGISYAGLAHVGSVPTDQWLAAALTGDHPAPPTRPGGGPPARFGGGSTLTLGQVSAAIQRAIERDFLRLRAVDRAHGLEVLVTGWTWPRRCNEGGRRPSTFAQVISHDGSRGNPCKVTSIPSRPFLSRARGWSVVAIGMPTRKMLDNINANIRAAPKPISPRAFEDILAQEIRGAASRLDSGIGTNLMSLYMPITMTDSPRVRYLRDPTQQQTRAAYTPAFIFSGGSITYPSIITGSGKLSLTSDDPGRSIQIECDPPLKGSMPLMEISSQRRRAVDSPSAVGGVGDASWKA